jgi:mutator protein MutT
MPPVEVAAGLVFRGPKLLITQRYPGAHLGGLWEFPGGKREPDETFEDCLRRELAEELGIEVTVGRLIETVLHDYGEKSILLKFYHCAWLRHEPTTLACHAFTWVDRQQITTFHFPAADARLLEKLQRDPKIWPVERAGQEVASPAKPPDQAPP